MQIEGKYKLDKLIEEDGRDTTAYIHVAEDKATATNGICIATVPCALGAGETPGTVTKESFAYGRKACGGDCVWLFLGPDTATARDSTQFPRTAAANADEKNDQLELFREEAKKQPVDWVEFIPEQNMSDVVLGINAALLKKLSDAIGSDQVNLRFQPSPDNRVRSIIRVEAIGGDGVGSIGPVRPKDDCSQDPQAPVDGRPWTRPETESTAHEPVGQMNVTIDMDKACAECNRPGACPNGLCLTCSTAAIGGKRMNSRQGRSLQKQWNEKTFRSPTRSEPAAKAWRNAITDDEIAEATAIIRKTKRASISTIQRRMKIGYVKAATIMDVLEERGIVGPPTGSEPREIHLSSEN
jgi:hypothetical protein